ncbi:MAG: hypothetical protein QXM27_00500 [Candidatus Pacearchaeota archaeon]
MIEDLIDNIYFGKKILKIDNKGRIYLNKKYILIDHENKKIKTYFLKIKETFVEITHIKPNKNFDKYYIIKKDKHNRILLPKEARNLFNSNEIIYEGKGYYFILRSMS